MMGVFPRRGDWVTLRLAATRDDDEQLVLLELVGACPGDPTARPVRASACESWHDAHQQAAARLAAGWAAHSTADRMARPASAAAALRAPGWHPAPAPPDRAEGDALAVVANAMTAEPEPFCLFPNPTVRR